MTAIYAGLTARQKLFVSGSAILAVFMSLAFAAWVMGGTLQSTQFSQQDQEIVSRLSGDTADPLHQSILRAHAIDAVTNLKQQANRQSVTMVAFAGAFALSAIGFALFLLGADGAIQLQAGQGKSGMKPWIAGTAPGILCLVLAMILAGMAVAHRTSVPLAAANFTRQIEGVVEHSGPRSPAAADAASSMAAQKLKPVAEQRNAARDAQSRATEQAAAAKLMMEKTAAEKSVADKFLADELAAKKAATEKAVTEKAATEKSAPREPDPEIAAAEKSATEKRAAQKMAALKVAAEKAAAAMLAEQKAADTKLAVSKAFVARLETDRVNADKLANDKVRADMAAADRLALDRAAREPMRAAPAAAPRVDVASLTAERIAAASTPEELYKRAVALRNEGETGRAVGLLRYASSSGHGPSSRLLVAIYRDGAPGVRANFREVERYQALAAAQGDR